MGLIVNRQNNLERMFEKFASDPVPTAKKEDNKELAKKNLANKQEKKPSKKK
ncbi:SPJ_0845 family protein [Liquorilactobacillus sicerae]|uniref:SPJ_0845 family protein n=1 Tax=Liquorilactobacillus sicerae TaxID=1416943 RepID=UPI0024810671|nr:SPJ_0845 family protein [Liquorilactobacillus sicerae]